MTKLIEVYATPIVAEIVESNRTTWLNAVSYDRRQQADRYIYREDTLRSLYSEVLLRWVLVNKHQINNESLAIARDSYGKPYLINSPLHFNISHSGRWCIVAVDDAPVGVDVEAIRKMDTTRIAERFFTASESAELTAMNEEERVRHFYKLWTVKESYVKANGKGLRMKLNSFSSCFNSGKILSDSPNELSYSFQSHEWDKEYALAVCSSKQAFKHTVNIIGDEVLSSWLHRS